MCIKGLKLQSSEVLVCTDEIVALKRSTIEKLRLLAAQSPKGRARVCAHKESTANIQEMIILINQEAYIAPHRHANKCESFHLIEGCADIVVFRDSGEIEKVIPFSNDAAFFYRLDSNRYHTIVVRSESIIFHEVTNGPFVLNATEFAPFAPKEGEIDVCVYRKRLDDQISAWLKALTE